jgi:hypothetical protein
MKCHYFTACWVQLTMSPFWRALHNVSNNVYWFDIWCCGVKSLVIHPCTWHTLSATSHVCSYTHVPTCPIAISPIHIPTCPYRHIAFLLTHPYSYTPIQHLACLLTHPYTYTPIQTSCLSAHPSIYLHTHTAI